MAALVGPLNLERQQIKFRECIRSYRISSRLYEIRQVTL